MNGFGSRRIGRIVNQAGIRSGPDRLLLPFVEAVVLAVYFPEDDDVVDDQKCIRCDVRTLGRQTKFLSKVPVLQHVHDLFDADWYVPRETKQDITGSVLVSEPSGTSVPTSAENCDGSHVVVGFFDGTWNKPFIFPFEIPHPNSRNVPAKSDGRTRTIIHHGTKIQIDKEGSVLIDCRGAAKEELGASGTEVSNSGVGGEIRFITKDGAGAEYEIKLDISGNVLIKDGAGNQIEFTKASGTIKTTAITKHEVDAPLIQLGTVVEPIIKGTTWGALWTAFNANVLIPQINTYSGAAPTVLVADYLALLTALQTLATGILTSLTTTTQAG